MKAQLYSSGLWIRKIDGIQRAFLTVSDVVYLLPPTKTLPDLILPTFQAGRIWWYQRKYTIGVSRLWIIPSVPHVRINHCRKWVNLAFEYLYNLIAHYCQGSVVLYVQNFIHACRRNYYMFSQMYTGETKFCVGLIGRCFKQNSQVATRDF